MNNEENRSNSSYTSYQPSGNGEGLTTQAKIGIGVGVLLAVVLLVLAIIFLLNNPSTTATIRDLFIIVLALQTFIIGTLAIILVVQLIGFVRMLRDDIKPMIESGQQTLNTVKGTTTFVSERVTKPAISVMGYASGIVRAIDVFIQTLPRRRN
jgi:hypothetical protein